MRHTKHIYCDSLDLQGVQLIVREEDGMTMVEFGTKHGWRPGAIHRQGKGSHKRTMAIQFLYSEKQKEQDKRDMERYAPKGEIPTRQKCP